MVLRLIQAVSSFAFYLIPIIDIYLLFMFCSILESCRSQDFPLLRSIGYWAKQTEYTAGHPAKPAGKRQIKALFRQFAFNQPCPIAGTGSKNIIVKIITIIMQHRPILGRPCPQPDIGSRLFGKHIGKIFSPH